jgi:predicted GIY-YIG superfamily endonuclease
MDHIQGKAVVDQTKNPYYTPLEADADITTRYPAKLEDAVARMKQTAPCPGATHWVYVLAYARSGVFYIDVAARHSDINEFCYANQDEQLRVLGEQQQKPLRLVLTEAFVSEADAQRRCDELRAMPHAWQRRLVDEANPEWLDLDQLLIGLPWVCHVGEDGLALFASMLELDQP